MIRYDARCLFKCLRRAGAIAPDHLVKKFGQDQIFSATDNKLFGQVKVNRFGTIQISEQKQLRFDMKTFFGFQKFRQNKLLLVHLRQPKNK